MTSISRLETYVRKVIQPPPRGYISVDDMKVKGGRAEKMTLDTDFSRMLLSSVIQNIVAYGAVGKDAVMEPIKRKINARIDSIPASQQAKEHALVGRHLSMIPEDNKINAPFISSLCWLLTYAPQANGGCRKYPDGGRIVPDDEDIRTIWELSRRSYAFLSDDDPLTVEFKSIYDVNAANFSMVTIDFLTESAAYKISPLSSIPQPRDTLLVYIWALLAGVERFGIYNPLWDVLYWSRLSDVPKATRHEIERDVLQVL